jgi:hypothetical protein
MSSKTLLFKNNPMFESKLSSTQVGATTLIIMKLIIMPFSILILNIKDLFATLSKVTLRIV